MDIIKRILAKRRADRQNDIEHKACEVFQISEHGGQLWLTFLDNLVCPCDMLKDAPVDAVTRMRELYIGRHEL